MFYDQGDKQIGIEEFQKIYEPKYFNDDKSEEPRIKSSRYVEEIIEEILEKGLNVDDFKLIIAWKIGAISHRKSENNKTVVYSGSYDNDLRWSRTNTNALPFIRYL